MRITLLLGTNSTGDDKLKPLVIGKSKNPRCFKGVKSLPIEYFANKKAWMNASLFHDWLLGINKRMKLFNRNILLFIDNCPANNDIPILSNIKVKFLPLNTTSKLQPLDQGIIRTFKSIDRKEVVLKVIEDIESGKKPGVNLLEAVRIIDKAWKNLKPSTIQNCFKT